MIVIEDSPEKFYIFCKALDGDVLLFSCDANPDPKTAAYIVALMDECKNLHVVSPDSILAWNCVNNKKVVVIKEPTRLIWQLIRMLISENWKNELSNPLS